MKTQNEINFKLVHECAESNGLQVLHVDMTEYKFICSVQKHDIVDMSTIMLPITLIEHDFLFHLFKKISEAI